MRYGGGSDAALDAASDAPRLTDLPDRSDSARPSPRPDAPRGAMKHSDPPPGWRQTIARATSLRRELHRTPELAWEEHATAALIRAELDRLAIGWRACAGTGTLATLAAAAQGRHVALRADIDGLAIDEAGRHAWRSQVPHRMHACGHDGHSAALLATAAWLRRHEAELPGPVTLIFQPAEEGGHGARRMVEEGALDGVDCVFGWHNWPALPFGTALCPDGVVMAANGTFRITVEGRGGHASQPEACRDPVLAGAAITVALQQVVSRLRAPQEAVVVSVTSFDARGPETVIPDRCTLAGSIRLSDESLRRAVERDISRVAASTAEAHGVTATVEHFPRYSVTRNHAEEASRYRAVLAAELGSAWRANAPLPIMASEDFGVYLEHRPGAFALVGSDPGDGTAHPCHSPHYDFNDALLPRVVRIYSRLAGLSGPSSPTCGDHRSDSTDRGSDREGSEIAR